MRHILGTARGSAQPDRGITQMKVQVRITNNGPIGGFTAEIKRDGEWKQVARYIGGGLVSFDSRKQAIEALQKEARRLVREV
jgi:hypothetical protein